MADQYSMTFGLAPAIVADFHRIFRHYSEIERVLIFGSRAKNTYKDSSDIDLAVIAPTMTDNTFAQLWNAIDDLPLVFKVDLLHWDKLTDERLKTKILREGQLFYSLQQQVRSG
jgi:proline iminopeptidase